MGRSLVILPESVFPWLTEERPSLRSLLSSSLILFPRALVVEVFDLSGGILTFDFFILLLHYKAAIPTPFFYPSCTLHHRTHKEDLLTSNIIVVSDETYEKAGVPLRLLGLKWTGWKRKDARRVLDHHRVEYRQRASELELLTHLDILVREQNLLRHHRMEILAVEEEAPAHTMVTTALQAVPAQPASATSISSGASYEYHETVNDTTAASDGNPEGGMEVDTDDGNSDNANPNNEMEADNRSNCVVCFETLTSATIPPRKITAACSHESDVCLGCLAKAITSQFEGRIWKHIDCPSCRARLGYEDVQAFATAATFRR